jgi:hypothetical protein
MNRRLVAYLAVLAVGLPAPLGAALDPDVFQVARLKYGGGGDWYSNPTSLPNLMAALRSRTGVRVGDAVEARVELLDESLFSYPLLYMNGHGEVRFSQAEVERLREYVNRGGFLWADDNYGMDRAFRREMGKVFPEAGLVELPFSHQIFHAFYDLPQGPPKVHEHDGKPPQALGIFQGGRLVVLYTVESDIGDGIEDPEVHNDPEPIREQAMRFAINVVMYAMTH